MQRTEIRGYVLALSLLGLAGAWTATARDVSNASAPDPETLKQLEAQERQIADRERALVRKRARVKEVIAERRRLARLPRPVRYVTVGGGGGSYRAGGGGSYSAPSGGGGSAPAPAPVTVAPVASTSS